MQFGKLVFATIAFLVLGGGADACRCAGPKDICEHIEDADMVLKATVVSKSQDSDRNDLVTYTVEAIAVFKNSSKAEKERKKIKFTTTGSSAACGIDLEIDKTYLLDLVYNGRKLSAVGSCGGWQLWKEVSDDDKNVLRNGCGDPCKGECDKHQECQVYAEGTEDEEHYCADVCDPSPCKDGKKCSLHPRRCKAPCPPVAVCTDDDQCYGECGEFQECRVVAKGTKSETPFYCADVCDPSPCDDGEVCELKPDNDTCSEDEPCPPKAKCKKNKDRGLCNGKRCDKFQECRVYAEGSGQEKQYCADVCHPKRCGRDEECKLTGAVCAKSPCPPKAKCKKHKADDRCNGECDIFQKCIQFKNKWTCSDTCKEGACKTGKKCKLKNSKKCRGRNKGKKGCPQKRKCYFE